MFANFRDGSSEVQREWRELVRGVDREVETALRHTVKRSLQELSRAINGDAKSDPQTLFGVKIVLENSRIDYKPTMINLTHVVNIVAKELISTVAAVPRLREVLNNPSREQSAVEGSSMSELAPQQGEKFPSFYSVISNDEDMLKIVVQIMNGMSSTATELQKYLGYWEK
jgi:dynein heavy chain